MDDDRISRLGQPGGAADRLKRELFRPVGVVRSGWCDVEFRWHSLVDLSLVFGCGSRPEVGLSGGSRWVRFPTGLPAMSLAEAGRQSAEELTAADNVEHEDRQCG